MEEPFEFLHEIPLAREQLALFIAVGLDAGSPQYAGTPDDTLRAGAGAPDHGVSGYRRRTPEH